MIPADLLNEPLTPILNPQSKALTELLKTGLTVSSLPATDKVFLNALLDNTSLVNDITEFVKGKSSFALRHIPEFVLFISSKFVLDKKTKIDLLECVKFIAQTVLFSSVVRLSLTEQVFLSQVLNDSITLLETNIRKPNSKGCFFWF